MGKTRKEQLTTSHSQASPGAETQGPSALAGAPDLADELPLKSAPFDHVTCSAREPAPDSSPAETDTALNVAIRQVIENLLQDDEFVNQLTRTIQEKLLNGMKESICQEVHSKN